MGDSLAQVLNRYLANQNMSVVKLAEATDISRKTLFRWTTNGPNRVHQWQALAKIARALNLDRARTNDLLVAGGKPTIDHLEALVLSDEDRALLDRWRIHAPMHNVPYPLTSFVGRQDELARIGRLLATPTARIVTLTGPGGSGKTRLALEAAHAVTGEFDGICFVDLAPVRDPNRVIPAIAEVLGVAEALDAPPQQPLVDHLRDARVLLVLDNVEQIVDAGRDIVKLLRSTKRLKVLVTSRSWLNVRGENLFAVDPLPLPPPSAGFADLRRNPAVRLFADRASAVDRSFSLTPANAPQLADLCARLDGLPLGIELAAVQMRTMTLPAILKRLPNRLTLASDGPHDLSERQRTLRETITWSYNLLVSAVQVLFIILGVLANGFSAEAAGAVCAALGMKLDVSKGLTALVKQNLIWRRPGNADELNYAMLETVREFAQERLAEHGQVEAARRAHATYYLTLAERADLQGDGQTIWLHRLSSDYENIGAALAWCRDQAEIEMGLRLSVALMPFWLLRDHWLEARDWLETFMAMDAAEPVSPSAWASGLLWQGFLLMRRAGDTSTPARQFEKALALFQREGDLNGMSETLKAQGDLIRSQEQWGEASQRCRESLALAMQSANAYLVAHAFMGLALDAYRRTGNLRMPSDTGN